MQIKVQLGGCYDSLAEKEGQEPRQNQWILDNIKKVEFIRPGD